MKMKMSLFSAPETKAQIMFFSFPLKKYLGVLHLWTSMKERLQNELGQRKKIILTVNNQPINYTTEMQQRNKK